MSWMTWALKRGRTTAPWSPVPPTASIPTGFLVRGRRVDNQPEARTVRVTADAMQIEPVLVAPLVAVPMLFVLLVLLLVKTRRKK